MEAGQNGEIQRSKRSNSVERLMGGTTGQPASETRSPNRDRHSNSDTAGSHPRPSFPTKVRQMNVLTGQNPTGSQIKSEHSAAGRSSDLWTIDGNTIKPTGHRFPVSVILWTDTTTSAHDSFRFHSPLRGSPGFTPGSLLAASCGPATRRNILRFKKMSTPYPGVRESGIT